MSCFHYNHIRYDHSVNMNDHNLLSTVINMNVNVFVVQHFVSLYCDEVCVCVIEHLSE